DYLRQGKDGYDVFRDGICGTDSAQAHAYARLWRRRLVRDCFASLDLLNGMMEQLTLEKVGDGPDMLKRYAINPSVEV
ncbi:Trifunctional nucleotide phosphoesterase protein YfkN, partial [Durusdinium trenchii]